MKIFTAVCVLMHMTIFVMQGLLSFAVLYMCVFFMYMLNVIIDAHNPQNHLHEICHTFSLTLQVVCSVFSKRVFMRSAQPTNDENCGCIKAVVEIKDFPLVREN